ncbi:MAG: hypothetical protein RJA22_2622 [Verrucomicrobiota bacterium]|jgi:flagellar export protein FliJ
MKSFRFSLQPLQVLRERQEQAALNAYARAVQAQTAAAHALQAARLALEAGWTAQQASVRQAAPAAQLAQAHQHCQVLERRTEACAQTLRAAQGAASQAFTRWTAARQASALLEQCRENQLREYRVQVLRHEQKRLDDLGRRRPDPTPSSPLPGHS